MAPSICGNHIQNRRDVIRFGWALTAVVTIAVFISSIAFAARNKALYNRYVSSYDYNNNNNNNNKNNGNNNNNMYNYYMTLQSLKSTGLRFTSLYTTCWAALLVAAGGFLVFLPEWATPIKLGIYMGALVMFANWALVSAVMVGEIWVYDNIERRQKEDLDVSQYALERSSAAFSTFSLILSVTYLAFALNLFLNHHVLLFDVAEEEKGAKRLSLMMRENVRRHGRTSSYVPPGSTNNEEFITRSSSSSDL